MPPPAVPTVPSGIEIAGIQRVWETYPTTPTITNGRPDIDDWTPVVHREVWGYFQVIVNGNDYTFFRDKLTRVVSYSHRVPFDDDALELNFPQITGYDELGAEGSDLEDFIDTENEEERVNVEVYLLEADDTQHLVFEGFIGSYVWRSDGTLSVECLGALLQLNLFVRAPGISNEPIDIGESIANQYNLTSRPSLRTQAMAEVVTGVEARYKGAWEPPTEFIRKLLAIGWDAADTRQWTVMMDDDRLPVLAKKKLMTDAPNYSITYGARGIKCEIQRELLNAPNVYYGEGEFAGMTWRGAHIDNDLGFYFQPISFDDEVHTYEEDPDTGDIVPTGTTLNPDRMRIESHLDFGSGFTPIEGAYIAAVLRDVNQDPGYVGTVTLDKVSPEETHAFLMQPDKILRIRHIFGTGNTGMKFYVSGVDVSASLGTVTLTVDTKGRDYDLVEGIRNRKDALAKNPVASLIVGRDSGLTQDSLLPWDWKTSGWVPKARAYDDTARFTIAGSTWVVFSMQTAERASIMRFEVHFDENVAFHVSVYDQDPTGFLPDNPMDAPTGTPPIGPWTEPPEGFQVGFGQYQGRVGYYPNTEYGSDGAATGATPTGDFVDEGGFKLNHDAAQELLVWDASRHYVAVWVDDSGTFNGWMRMSPGKFTS